MGRRQLDPRDARAFKLRDIGAGTQETRMKALGIGLAAVLIVAAVASSAFADTISAADRKAGMDAGPGLIAATKVPCTLTDARKAGGGKGPTGDVTVYELACSEGLGYIIFSPNK